MHQILIEGQKCFCSAHSPYFFCVLVFSLWICTLLWTEHIQRKFRGSFSIIWKVIKKKKILMKINLKIPGKSSLPKSYFDTWNFFWLLFENIWKSENLSPIQLNKRYIYRKMLRRCLQFSILSVVFRTHKPVRLGLEIL